MTGICCQRFNGCAVFVFQNVIIALFVHNLLNYIEIKIILVLLIDVNFILHISK